jgi:hypothetical protein
LVPARRAGGIWTGRIPGQSNGLSHSMSGAVMKKKCFLVLWCLVG